jgi:hypothetical protein
MSIALASQLLFASNPYSAREGVDRGKNGVSGLLSRLCRANRIYYSFDNWRILFIDTVQPKYLVKNYVTTKKRLCASSSGRQSSDRSHP